MHSKCIDAQQKNAKRPAAKREGRIRTNRRHGAVILMAAEIAGVSPSMVYKVRTGAATSAPVKKALKIAEERLRQQNGSAAA
jgi:hypothetical protein